jgi:sugar phosphate isomerase/epimerase
MAQRTRRRVLGEIIAGAAAAAALPLAGLARQIQPEPRPTIVPSPERPEPKIEPMRTPRLHNPDTLFSISLAQWSLHRTLQKGELDNLDFPRTAKRDYGIDAVEYVNAFFKGDTSDAYVAELKKRCEGEGVKSLLIMCDGEGNLGDPDEFKRIKAVENHHKWVAAAAALGCHSIRVNASSEGEYEEQQRLAADGLRRLCEHADKSNINVIVENHWGNSSVAKWLVGVMKLVDHPRVGTLPDFGNFDPKVQNRYEGVEKLMPYAKGVSAKSYEFGADGREVRMDYDRLLRIVLKAGYRGRIGIEWEGDKISEPEGIRATKKLLEKLRIDLSAEFAS